MYKTFVMREIEIGVISSHGYQTNWKSSFEATQWIGWKNIDTNGRIIHEQTEKEYKSGRYFVDGIDEAHRTEHEYNGCVLHGHPECTEKENEVPFSNLLIKEALE